MRPAAISDTSLPLPHFLLHQRGPKEVPGGFREAFKSLRMHFPRDPQKAWRNAWRSLYTGAMAPNNDDNCLDCLGAPWFHLVPSRFPLVCKRGSMKVSVRFLKDCSDVFLLGETPHHTGGSDHLCGSRGEHTRETVGIQLNTPDKLGLRPPRDLHLS